MELRLGHHVRCTNGQFGELADVVIDPSTRRVTHLVVEPHRRPALARLVPVELASVGDDSSADIDLRCTLEHVRRLPPVEEFAFLRIGDTPPADPEWDVGVERVLVPPSAEYPGFAGHPMAFDPHVAITYHRVPKGEVEIGRASTVVSADGHRLGRIEAFVVDGADGITHLVLERRHMFGRRDVTIPIDAVVRVATDSITLELTKDDVRALRAVPVHRRVA
jgi:sporulation protein YlmC with PRC-barrel domain